ncbi:ABC transporter substrate-binding protein [Luteolibacter sp. AS25]|uniref:ABC transporter substrate-binding protein n=1 Tax=Luteolibacter sp. AS25 TaxID=3135776 RepID=UPI00398A7214
MKARIIGIVLLLGAIVGLPLALKKESNTASPDSADDRLVILSPHNESIRKEFGEAFAKYWREKTGRTIYVDWRTPGGTSEIRMVIDSGFKAAEETGREGIGVDLFFGGGQPDFSGQAKAGRLVPLDVFKDMPLLFGESGAVPEIFTGESYFDEDRLWVVTCVSQFGICYNPDFVERLGMSAPEKWLDLGEPGFIGSLALADPTKSGSVARTFELLVQGQMQKRIAEGGSENAAAEGWADGLRLIQRMSANARYFTDSASKIPQDVGQGNAAAGMCIDFYGRSYANELTTRDGKPRVVWIAPVGGTTLSGDPIAVLKGAPHMEVAQEFVKFCLSKEAQGLWFLKPGVEGGPLERSLYRAPVRRDLYVAEMLSKATMPEMRPFTDPGNFTYDPALTGKAFNTLRKLVKVMCIDSHHELQEAWQAMIDAGMPAEAIAVFEDVSKVGYEIVGQGDPGLNSRDSMVQAERMKELGEWFRANYREAKRIAEESGNVAIKGGDQ